MLTMIVANTSSILNCIQKKKKWRAAAHVDEDVWCRKEEQGQIFDQNRARNLLLL